jgi:hypothetical protein
MKRGDALTFGTVKRLEAGRCGINRQRCAPLNDATVKFVLAYGKRHMQRATPAMAGSSTSNHPYRVDNRKPL